MLIWFSYSVNNHHVLAVGLQEASLKMGPILSLKCVVLCCNMYDEEGPKSV